METALAVFRELDRHSRDAWIVGCRGLQLQGGGAPEDIYYRDGLTPVLTITQDEIALAKRSIDLSRFLTAVYAFEVFVRSLLLSARVAGHVDLSEKCIEYLSFTNPNDEQNVWGKLSELLECELDNLHFSCCQYDCKRKTQTKLIAEYFRVRNTWGHQAGHIDDDFLGKVPAIAKDGWFRDLDKCWVLSGPPGCPGLLEQVVRDLDVVARGLALASVQKYTELNGHVQ